MSIGNTKNILKKLFLDFVIIIMFFGFSTNVYSLCKELYIRNSDKWVKINADITNRSLHAARTDSNDKYYFEYTNINNEACSDYISTRAIPVIINERKQIVIYNKITDPSTIHTSIEIPYYLGYMVICLCFLALFLFIRIKSHFANLNGDIQTL